MNLKLLKKELAEKSERTGLPLDFLLRVGIEMVLTIPDENMIDAIEIHFCLPQES